MISNNNQARNNCIQRSIKLIIHTGIKIIQYWKLAGRDRRRCFSQKGGERCSIHFGANNSQCANSPRKQSGRPRCFIPKRKAFCSKFKRRMIKNGSVKRMTLSGIRKEETAEKENPSILPFSLSLSLSLRGVFIAPRRRNKFTPRRETGRRINVESTKGVEFIRR